MKVMMKQVIPIFLISWLLTGCSNNASTAITPLNNDDLVNQPTKNQNNKVNNIMQLISPAFKPNEKIPQKYTCDGANINPSLVIEDVPNGAKTLTLILDDPDAPGGPWLHWTVWDINATAREIAENSVPIEAVQGATSFGQPGYGGPCPPSGTHHYHFKLYALDAVIKLAHGASLNELEQAMNGHIIAQAELVGLYSRK